MKQVALLSVVVFKITTPSTCCATVIFKFEYKMLKIGSIGAKPEFNDLEVAGDEVAGDVYDDFYEIDDVASNTLKEIKLATKRDRIAGIRVEELNIAKIKKETLATWVADMSIVLAKYRQAMKPAADTIEKLYENTIADKSEIIKLQNAVIRKNSEQMKELSSTVQTEMKSYCDIVKKSCKKSAVSPEKLKSVVKCVAEEEDRKSNLIVFGCAEDTDEDLANVVSEVLETVDVKPKVIESSRMGGRKEGHCRPIKVKLSSQDSVNTVLRNSRKLKGSGNLKQYYTDQLKRGQFTGG